MSVLYIWEFSQIVVRDDEEFPQTPGILQQVPVPIDQTVHQSARFNAATAFVYITADVACFIDIGSNVNSGIFALEQGRDYLFGVNPGDLIAVSANPHYQFAIVTDDGTTWIVFDPNPSIGLAQDLF